MSADNAIYYRQIGDKWYVKEGSASNEYTDEDYLRHGAEFDSLEDCLVAASKLAEDCVVLEYGIIRD